MTFEVARHACVCVPALTSLPILITSACRGRSSLPWRPNVYSSAAVCHNLTSQHLRKTPQLYPPKPWGTEESQSPPPPIVVPSPFIIMSLPGIRWTFQSTVGIQRAIKLHSDKVKVFFYVVEQTGRCKKKKTKKLCFSLVMVQILDHCQRGSSWENVLCAEVKSV